MNWINKLKTAVLIIGVLLTTACNKGSDNFLYKGKMLPISFKGYNGTDKILEIKIDTVTSPNQLPFGPYNFTDAYMVPNGRTSVKVTVREMESGEKVIEKELKIVDGPASLNFVYMNGKLGDMPDKATVEEGKIKLTYLLMPTTTQYSEPVDIVFGKYYATPKVFEEIATVKNVKPYEFSPTVTLPTFSTAPTQYNGVNTTVSFLVYIYKAGTKDFYTSDQGYTWHPTLSTLPKPAASIGSSKLYIISEAPVGNSMRFFKNLEQ